MKYGLLLGASSLLLSTWHGILGYMIAITVACLLSMFIGCRTPQTEPASIVEQSSNEQMVPAASPFEWKLRLGDVALSDSVRLVAASQLQRVAPETLAANWGYRDNARIIRQLIERRTAAADEGVLPLLLLLFEQVEGEERIDFEHDILHFGRKAESRMYELLHADNRSLVMRAMDALAKMQSPIAGDSIALLLDNPDPWLRIGAAHALGEIGAQSAVGQLVQTLDDTVYSVVNAALVGLGRLKAAESYGRVVSLTESDNKHVRKHAVIALGELGDRRGLSIVRSLAGDDPDSGVRFMAGKAAEKLEQAP